MVAADRQGHAGRPHAFQRDRARPARHLPRGADPAAQAARSRRRHPAARGNGRPRQRLRVDAGWSRAPSAR